jgi:hypothetical protein
VTAPAGGIGDVTDADLNLTAEVDADTYVRVVLQARADAATRDPRFPPLLPWMVRDADVPWVRFPDPAPRRSAPAKPARSRPPADIAALRARLDRLNAERDRLGAAPSDDPACCRLSGRTLRRTLDRMDRDLARYAALEPIIRRLEWQIADATGAIGGRK